MPSIYLVSYFRADQITLHSSLHLASDFSAVHPLGELSSCRPFNFSSLSELFLCRPLVLHSLGSYFHADHITLHPSVPLASYFCAIHPLRQLFSCRPFNFPSFGELFLCHPSFGRVFLHADYLISPFTHTFGELILYHPSLG